MQSVKYTFLLPAFKTKFFAEALNSIKNQTFKNFKCLVSDDCSPEDLKSIFVEVVGDDSRFEYRRNIENMGSKSLVSHWNFLVDRCDTEFFIMASDDDVYELNFLEEINNLQVSYPEVDLLRSRMDIVNENCEPVFIEGHYDKYENREEFCRSHFKGENARCLPNHAFRTKELKAKGGFYETPLGWYSDQITAIMIAENGCANTADILFHFRISDVNISNAKPTKKIASQKAMATVMADKWLSDYLKNGPVPNLTYRRWGEQVYYWLMDSNFKTFLFLLPSIIRNGLWDKKWMTAITKHQLKMLLLNR